MKFFASTIIIVAALAGFSSAAAPPLVRRETNAQRLARGLPPLPPNRAPTPVAAGFPSRPSLAYNPAIIQAEIEAMEKEWLQEQRAAAGGAQL